MDFFAYLKQLWDHMGNYGARDYTDILEKINELDAETSGLPEKPRLDEPGDYKRKTYDAPTDEEIEESARRSLESYRLAGQKSIDDNTEASRKKYEADRAAGSESYEKTLAEIARAYDEAAEKAGNDVLKRGLARSSIAANVTAGLRGEQAAKSSEAYEAYAAADRELQEKLSGLEAERQKALGDFDLEYSAKLTERIDELTKERQKLQDEVIEYNNSITKQENEDEVNRRKAESDLYSEALDQAVTEGKLRDNPPAAAKDRRDELVYFMLRDKLLTLEPDDAREAVRHDMIFREYLPDEYFYKLYYEFVYPYTQTSGDRWR